MSDPFELLNEDLMTPSPQPAPKPTNTAPSKEGVRKAVNARGVCPFCGQQRPAGTTPCPACTMENTPATRAATKQRIGPWYVLQTRNPSAPGMNYETVITLISRGQITPRSVMRGPTTAQLWRAAANVRGISREFGLCYNCGRHIDKHASMCAVCQRSQEPPPDPDVLLEDRKQAAIDESSHTARLNAWQRQRTSAVSRAPLLPPPSTAPTREQSSANWSRDGRVVSAVGLASALADPNASIDKPSRRGMKLMGVLAVLLIGGGILLWAKPDYRESTFEWTSQHWAMLKEQASSIQVTHGGSSTVEQPKANAVRPVPSKPVEQPPIVANDATPDTSTAQPAVAKIDPQPPAEVKQPPQVVVQTPNTPEVTISDNGNPYDQARKWWSSAIDAEANNDFGSAVKYYEKIKSLPQENWQYGLQQRLDLAKQRLQSAEAK